ncbi:MAG TPA: hypothetical protein VL418_05135 [Devosiaceae bacterium]|nr:hypothetical protein [Devosiaceae bacterium]
MSDYDGRGVETTAGRRTDAVRFFMSAVKAPVSREAFFAALLTIGFANALIDSCLYTVQTDGWLNALIETFGVSVFLWGACVAAVIKSLKGQVSSPVRQADLAVGALLCLGFLVPVSLLSWATLGALAPYLYFSSRGSPALKAAAIIALAAMLPSIWGRLVFAVVGSHVLHLDALLVGSIMGTAVIGNTVAFREGSDVLIIYSPCSSVHNVSLAIMWLTTVVTFQDRKWNFRSVSYCLAACAAVVAINVCRMAVMTLSVEWYELAHGPVGANIANWLNVVAILIIGFQAMRNDAPETR